MSDRTAVARTPGSSGTLLERVAWRVALGAAERIRVGALTVVLPDGTRRSFGQDDGDLRG